MSLAALAKQLHEAGTPVEGIILALEAVEARERAAAEKRAQAAERKRRQRERERDCHATITGQSRDNTPSLDKETLPPTPPIKEINPTPANTHGGGAPTRKAWACPDGVSPDHWRDFLTNRRRKKLASTPTAYDGQLRLIDRFADDDWPPGELVRLAAEKGWGTIVDPHEALEHRNGNRTHHAPGPNPRPARTGRSGEMDDAWRDLGFGG